MPDAPRRRAPRGGGAALRGEVLQAAMDLLAESGDVNAVSLRAVAQRVGVSVPAIYLHFADKQALLDAVCDAVFTALHTRLLAVSEQSQDCFEVLRLQGIAYVEFALENPEHYRIIMMQRPEPTAGEDAAAFVAGGAFIHLVASVQRCIDEGVFTGDPVPLAMQLWAATHGVAALLISKPDFPWPDGFIADTVVMAGLGLMLKARLADEDMTAASPTLLKHVNRVRR